MTPSRKITTDMKLNIVNLFAYPWKSSEVVEYTGERMRFGKHYLYPLILEYA